MKGRDVVNLDTIVKEIAEDMAKRTDRGRVATYIPELAGVEAARFGLAVIDREGNVFAGGDSEVPFSIQSISKVFTLTLALGTVGDRLWRRVGREPSGNAFNSIVQLERERGVPRNPFINAGAIAVTDAIVSGHEPRETLGEILRFMRFLADDPSIVIDHSVAASEKRTGFRNTALANYMKSFGVLDNPVDFTLGVYFHHCAIAMSCRQLASAGQYLAYGGRKPSTGFSVVSPERARRINALMLTCGHYDGSGNSPTGSGCRARAASAAAFSQSHPARRRSPSGLQASTRPATLISVVWRSKASPSAWAGRYLPN